MRADMTPEEVRAAGIYLNGGRRRGWKRRLSALLATPEATISAWATRSAGNARSVPGVAAVAIRLLVAMLRQEFMSTADPVRAVDALTERTLALIGERELFPTRKRPFDIGRVEQDLPAMAATPPPAKWLGIKNARPRAAKAQAEQPAAPDPLMFAIKRRPGGSRSGRPGSSA